LDSEAQEREGRKKCQAAFEDAMRKEFGHENWERMKEISQKPK
jgi:hypothetical protein